MIYSKRIVEAKQNHGASGNIKAKARELRKSMTRAEKLLWSRLRKLKQGGMHFRKQHPYGIYIIDFYCFKAGLAIEIDGKIHLKSVAYDREKSRFLESSGLKVLRFKNEDIEKRIEWVVESINKYLSKPHP